MVGGWPACRVARGFVVLSFAVACASTRSLFSRRWSCALTVTSPALYTLGVSIGGCVPLIGC